MPIQIRCECGKLLAVPDSAVGKRVKCGACGAPLQVPAPGEGRPQAAGRDASRPVRRRRFHRGSKSTFPPALIAAIVFVVLAGSFVGLYIAYGPTGGIVPKPTRAFFSRWKNALNGTDSSAARNLIHPDYLEKAIKSISRQEKESAVDGWLRVNRERLDVLRSCTFEDVQPAGSGRRRVICKNSSGALVHFFIRSYAGRWMFDGFE